MIDWILDLERFVGLALLAFMATVGACLLYLDS